MRLTIDRRAQRSWRRAILFLAILALIAGCGSDNDDQAAVARKETQEKALALLTQHDIARTPPGSPQRTVLEWWRALQFRDASTVSRLFTPQARDQIGPGLSETVFVDLGPSLQRAAPRIQNTDVLGDTALVYLTVVRNEVVSPKIIRQQREFLGLSLRRVAGRWRIDDPTFFLQTGRTIREARLEAERRAAAERRANDR